MGTLLSTFTFDRNTFRRSAAESAKSVAEHIQKVARREDLDKTASNIVGALGTYMGIFAKNNSGDWSPTPLSETFMSLVERNEEDSWRWLVARSLWLFVVPNGTLCKVNSRASQIATSFAFFHTVAQLLVLLSSQPGERRFLYFEELCQILNDDSNWDKPASSIFQQLLNLREQSSSGFGSQRGFLGDLEDEFNIPRDNLNGLFSKAFSQTGFFETLAISGKSVAVALRESLDPTVQERLRFILDHPPGQFTGDWADHLALRDHDLPAEVVSKDDHTFDADFFDSSDLTAIVPAACAAFEKAGLRCNHAQVLRFVASLLTKRFLIVTGLSGSGKTKLAQAFAAWLSPERIAADAFKAGASIISDRAQYFVAASDSISVELWNSQDEALATKVVLPREMIREWADYISENHCERDVSPRSIRDAVKDRSQFSDQLHSFESQLKAAAFAALESTGFEYGAKSYAIVPVGADWMGNENVLGYPDGLDRARYSSKPTLELILNAIERPEVPHFLILDEMNLSHVERYFADLLSAIESGEAIPLHQDNARIANGRLVPGNLQLPSNLFIIGTVNVDETTYMFSPKVLDRANVIEFRMLSDEMATYLGSPDAPDLDVIYSSGQVFGSDFVTAGSTDVEVPSSLQGDFTSEIKVFFESLRDHGSEFGYRVARDASRLVAFLDMLTPTDVEDKDRFNVAFDFVIAQKLLPKLHGSRTQLGPLLKQLWFLCTSTGGGDSKLEAARDAAKSTNKQLEPSITLPAGSPYPVSAEKIGRMWRLLNDNGFTSFAEA